MAKEVSALNQSGTPWEYEIGDLVAKKMQRDDGALDPLHRGVVDARWLGELENEYRVCVDGGRMCFNARASELTKLE